MENFTPVSATLGGILIGLSAVLLMALNGRIAGISGIFSGMVFAAAGDRLWRLLFIAGLVAGPILYRFMSSETIPFTLTSSWPMIVAGGLLVGFGTRLGSGCTSGHGVCGLSRLSIRSLVAVGLFMVSGMVTVYFLKALTAG
ncbi:MAG: YeeE/YedE family protein [Granulosicoccus sp.]|nr:YeeE/YedE family protein [Granulosicoccus sp.]